MEKRVVLEGSFREHPENAIVLDHPTDSVQTVTVVLRRKKEIDDHSEITHEELANKFGAHIDDVGAVDSFCARYGLTVTQYNLGTRTMKVSGKLSQLAEAFGATVQCTAKDNVEESKAYQTRLGTLSVPAELDGLIVGVLGFDKRPQAKPHIRAVSKDSGSVSYTPPQIAERYDFPKNKGAGQTVAILELGGGYNDSDLQQYWQLIGVSPVKVSSVGVDGAVNSPSGDPGSADGEVGLDIEVIGGIAPEASIVVYFTTNTDQGFLDGINAVVQDTTNKPKVLSISWGGPESSWTAQAMTAISEALHDASLLGITVCIASGDNGADDGVGDGNNHVDFPASSPWAIACGGTSLPESRPEVVWNDGANGGASGGGYSTFFAKPRYYQTDEIVSGNYRGVPDVAGDADPNTGWITIVDGSQGVIGGTSAVAPLWAGLIALCNEVTAATAGWIGKVLYLGNGPEALVGITQGNNGVPGLTSGYKAGKGWNPCCGLGRPDGQKVMELLKQHRGSK